MQVAVDVTTPELSVMGYSMGIMRQLAYLVLTQSW